MIPKPMMRSIIGISYAWLLVAATLAHAAGGHNITEQQEAQVKVGMSQAEVLRILGQPMEKVRYRYAPGPTWFYDVLGTAIPVPTVFEVAFGTDGTVVSAREYPDLSRNSGP